MKNDAHKLFWRKVVKGTDDECWLWSGACNKDGYGSAWWDKKPIAAHRLSFLIHNGHLPNVCRHKCDVRECVNPAHLEDGTQADNIRDCVERGRHKSGNTGKTHCPQGHDYSDPNVVHIDKRNMRHCRICDRHRKAAKRTQPA
jgi:hypothetical protein